jgi:hypothetical protein
MSYQNLIGAWKLVSAEYRRKSGEAIEIYGANPMGQLIYDARGNMSIQIMRQGRPKFAAADRLGGTPEEKKAALEGYLAYFGTFTINVGRQSVTHHIQGSLLPNWVGVDQERFFEVNGDQLTLRTPSLMIGGEDAVGQIVWERSKS